MRILFVAQASSVHAARWINQFSGLGWDLHVFDPYQPTCGIAPLFREGTYYVANASAHPDTLKIHETLKPRFLDRIRWRLGRPVAASVLQERHESELANLICRLQPDIVHQLGMGVNWRNVGLPILHAKKGMGVFPCPWLYSSWGSDLEIFGAQPRHRQGVTAVLENVDFHIAECERDQRLARQLGFRGETLDVFPAFGGTDVGDVAQYRSRGCVSARRTIVLKGRGEEDPVGRAMTAMRAFERNVERLRPYRIAVLQATDSIRDEAAVLRASTGLDIQVLPRLSYGGVLRILGSARALVALTVNDGLPSILVEAMALGALPVHSDLEPIREWIEPGKSGLLVDPESIDSVSQAVERMLSDDKLVEDAALRNAETVRNRLAADDIRQRAIAMYTQISASRG